jgi:hypothetical protein
VIEGISLDFIVAQMVKNSDDLRHPTFRHAHKYSPLQSVQYPPCGNCLIKIYLIAAVVTGQLSLRSDLLTARTPCGLWLDDPRQQQEVFLFSSVQTGSGVQRAPRV